MKILLVLALVAGPALAIAEGPTKLADQTSDLDMPAAMADPVGTLSAVIGHMQEANRQVKDATCIFHKKEYKKGNLPAEVIDMKVRAQPPSVYMKWKDPEAKRDREVIWRAGWNDNEICARSGSTVLSLAPNSRLAMKDDRHPISDAGFASTIKFFADDLEIGRNDPKCFTQLTGPREEHVYGSESDCYEMETDKADKARCPHLYGYRAQFCIDKSSELPNKIQVWDLEDGQIRLVESYGYEQIRVNVGLTDADFDPSNEAYGFRERNLFSKLFLGCK